MSFNVLHGTICEDSVTIGDWEAQPVEAGHEGRDVYEYRVDLEPNGIPQRFTGNFVVPAGTDSIVVTSEVLKRVAGYR